MCRHFRAKVGWSGVYITCENHFYLVYFISYIFFFLYSIKEVPITVKENNIIVLTDAFMSTVFKAPLFSGYFLKRYKSADYYLYCYLKFSLKYVKPVFSKKINVFC